MKALQKALEAVKNGIDVYSGLLDLAQFSPVP